MKLSGARAEAFLRNPDPRVRAVLVYGPDGGLVRERGDALARRVVDDIADPFRVVELTPGRFRDDPARLADEAAALSFTGGRRVIRLRPAVDAQSAILKRLLDDPVGDALVIAEAGELAPRSALRRLFEGAGNAAALACYLDEGNALRRLIEDSLASSKLSAEPAAVDYLSSTLGGDRLVTRSELDKLATYMGEAGHVTLADVENCVGDSAALSLDAVALAAASGDLPGLERGLTRAWLEGANPVTVLRAMARHLDRLYRAAALVAEGASPDAAIGALRPKPHFRVAAALRNQLGRWTATRAAQAIEIVLEAEIACKTTGMPAESLCGRALMRLAQAARPRSA